MAKFFQCYWMAGFIAKQAQVIRKASGWHVLLTLQADVDVPEVQPQGQPLSINVGLKSFLATSDGPSIALSHGKRAT